MYDVANRESFDALPKWFSELETYVSSAVVKIIVGNKVDKVCSARTARNRTADWCLLSIPRGLLQRTANMKHT